MVYYANGGFNWHDLYFMPTKLREFYWRELVATKEEEKKQYDTANNKMKSSGRVRHR